MDFQVIAAGRRQQVTPLRDALRQTAENTPPTTGNSFGTLAHSNASPPLATNVPVGHAADSDDALYKAVRASHPNVANIVCLQDQRIETLDTKWSAVLQALALKQSQEIAKRMEQVQHDAAK